MSEELKIPDGWALLDKNGEAVDFHPRVREFFGAMLDNDAPKFDAEWIAAQDREWPGRAPHRCIEVFYASPPLPSCCENSAPGSICDACAAASRGYSAAMGEPIPPEDGWINVADRLPPKFEEVLIAFRGSSLPATGQYTGSPHDNDDGWCYPSENSGDETDWTVTHWRPLPPPPAALEPKEQQ